MSKLPLVSIIIPLYNAERYIASTIKCALNQSYENVEVIVVDDGSKDKSLEIAKSFISDKLQVFSQHNRGASAARNLGLRNAKGDFIQFLDADDLISENKIQRQVEMLQSLPNSISFCSTIDFKSNENINENPPTPLSVIEITDPFKLLLHLYGGFGNASMITVHSWLTPRSVIELSGLWNEELTLDDDGEFFCRNVLNSSRVVYCPNVFSYYRKYDLPSSLSSQKTLRHFNSELKSTHLKAKYLLSRNDCFEVRKAMSFWYIRLAINAYPKHRKISKEAIFEIKKLNVRPDIPTMGGPLVERLKAIFGWKLVRILQFLSSTL